jgi:MFS transporter, DHA1 family, inner membrane transport protein
MTFFANRDVNRLVIHATLNELAFCFSGVFSAVFLLRAGLSVPEIFLLFGAIMVLRFVLRPLVPMAVLAIGLRRSLILGTVLQGTQYPVLALVHGVAPALVVYCAISALGQVFYWTTFHAFFSALGDSELRGSQVAERQMFGTLADVLGPAAGGVMLAAFGPWPAFLTAFAIQMIAVLPLLYVAEPAVVRDAPAGAYAAAKNGFWLFVSGSWIFNSSATAWSIIVFRALTARYDAYGALLAAGALAGAVSGMQFGRFIDRGHALRLAWVNGAILVGSLIVKAGCGEDTLPVIAVALGTTIVGGLYIPSLMTAIYNEAKLAPCPLRFQFVIEGGWDIGGVLACLTSAAVCAAGLPLQIVILLALPAALWQLRLLLGSYATLDAKTLSSRAAM